MYAAERAVAHDKHMVAGPRSIGNRADERCHVGVGFRLRAQRCKRRARVPSQARRITKDAVGSRKTCREGIFHYAELHRVGARLEHRDDSRTIDLRAQAIEGRADRRRMMREVIVNTDAVYYPPQFEAP